MATVFATEVIPLAADADGVVRIGGTRVTLDTVVGLLRMARPLKKSFTSILRCHWPMYMP